MGDEEGIITVPLLVKQSKHSKYKEDGFVAHHILKRTHRYRFQLERKKKHKTEMLIRPTLSIRFRSIMLVYLSDSYSKALKSEENILRVAPLTIHCLQVDVQSIFLFLLSVCVLAVG